MKKIGIKKATISCVMIVVASVTALGWDAMAQYEPGQSMQSMGDSANRKDSDTMTPQDPEQEHLSHHPGLQQENGQISQSIENQPSGPAGMMGQMGEMMKQMNLPKPKELYPSLMEFPELPIEKRVELEATAHQRMKSSIKLFSEGIDRLSREAVTDNYAAMQESVKMAKEGLAQFESSLATHRALAEGKSPRNVALQWFKREMNLDSSAAEYSKSTFEFSWFHFSLMLILTVFAAVMIGMYFFKMRRVSFLLQDVLGNAPPASSVKAAPVPASASEQSSATPRSERSKKWSGKLRVSHIFKETPDVRTFRLMNPLGGMFPFSYLPGQFLSITVLANGKAEKRSYTIASSPTQNDYAEITVKHKEGTGVSDILFNHVQEGDLLDFSGPSGAFTFTGRECKCILLIGAGVGITPLMSVLRYLTDRSWPGDIYLLYGNSTPKDIIFKEEFEYLMRRHANLHVVFTVSNPEGTDWGGPTGHIDKEFIARSVPDITSRYVHICGPVPMMEAVKKIMAELGVPKDRIKIEAFGPALGRPEPAKRPGEAELGKKEPGVALSTVRFALSDKSAPLPSDKTILDVADEIGVEIDNSCRAGICGLCKVKLRSGKVSMEVEDALTPEDKAEDFVLACQAKSTGNIEVEA